MALKSRLPADDYSKLDPTLQSAYRKEGDLYLLDLEDDPAAPLKKAIAAEREAAEAAKKAAKALKDQYEGIDPDAARKALKELEEVKDKQLLDEGKVEELLNKRTEAMRISHENQIKKLAADAEAAAARAADLDRALFGERLRNTISQAAVKGHIRESALDDVFARAERVWKMQDGKLVPFGADGQVRFGKKAVEPMTPDEWIADLQESAPHLFEASRGAGTPPGTGRVNAGTFSISRDQARDPGLYRAAREQAAKAGVELRVTD